MDLLLWVGAWVLLAGVIGGLMGGLAARAARPTSTPLHEMVSAFFVGRAGSLRSAAARKVRSGAGPAG